MNTWRFLLPRGRRLEIGARPLIAAVINCTPDSFSDGGVHGQPGAAVRAGLDMLRAGADWLDVGGESTRPGSRPVPPAKQLRRILPVIQGLRAATEAPISVDTMDPEVGGPALDAGADIVNDVSGLRSPGWRAVLDGRGEVPVVVAHMRGTPLDMQVSPEYPEGVTATVRAYLETRLRELEAGGISRDRVILDPGLGFGKRVEDNLELIRNIDILRDLGRPILIGASRKGFIGKVLGPGFLPRPPGAEGAQSAPGGASADIGTLIVNAIAIFRGANVLRVHDVGYASALVRMLTAVMGQGVACKS